MDIKSRLLMYIRHKNISIKQFEEKSGMSNGYISSMRKGLGTEKLDNVLSSFPDLNREWLLYGEGEMLKNNQQVGDVTSSTIIGANVNGNGIKITHNDLSGMIELQKGYQDMIKKSQEQIDRLIGIIEQNVKFP